MLVCKDNRKIHNNKVVGVLVFPGPIYIHIFLDVCHCVCASKITWRSGEGLAINSSQHSQLKMKINKVSKLPTTFGTQWLLIFFTEIDCPDMKHFKPVLNACILVGLPGRGSSHGAGSLLSKKDVVILSSHLARIVRATH